MKTWDFSNDPATFLIQDAPCSILKMEVGRRIAEMEVACCLTEESIGIITQKLRALCKLMFFEPRGDQFKIMLLAHHELEPKDKVEMAKNIFAALRITDRHLEFLI